MSKKSATKQLVNTVSSHEFYSAIHSRDWVRRILFFILASLPVIAYFWRFAISNRHGIFIGEDWDEFAQAYQAARITIIHYHQFPWWNSWSIGGEPLFGNPQFGLFSIQMVLVLLFGTVVGLHLSMAVYFLLGFWGMYRLLKRIGTNLPLSLLLSYIWIFSGFPAWHLSGGHLTFAVYLLAPWVLLSLINIRRPRGWLWFALMIGLIFNTAIDYMTIQLSAIVGVLAVYELVMFWRRNNDSLFRIILPYIKAGILILILVLPKALYTWQFTHEYPFLNQLDDKSLPVSLFVAAVTSRHALDPRSFFPATWAWSEYADYFGIITLFLVIYMIVKKMLGRLPPARDILLLVGILLTFLLFLGSFAKFSPYYLLHTLPVFKEMRVPSRYICWFVLGAIVLLRQLPKRKIIYILLAISVVDVFAANWGIINYAQKTYIIPPKPTHSFQQYAYYDADGVKNLIALSDFRLLKATENNYGEVYGYEPIVGLGEYFLPITIRCGVNQGCNFVMTNNAKVNSWSPNKITLERTNSGPIELDMNPGKVWSVNGKNIFSNYKILQMNQPFTINDSTKIIVVSFTPRL